MGTKAKFADRGRWQENPARWYEQTLDYCDACGMLIPRKQFVVEDNGVKRLFCGPDCAQLFCRTRVDTKRK